MKEKTIKIEDLGWNGSFDADRKKFGSDGFSVARVIAEYKGAYKVKNTKGEYLARITGKQMRDAISREDYPAVGDWVMIVDVDQKQVTIHAILPRKTIMKRRYSGKDEIQIIATNIDVAFVIESVDRDYNLNRLERYFAIARDGGIQPAVIINKIDLISQEELDMKLAEIKNRLGEVDVIPTSTFSEAGLEKLKKYITPGKTYCFLGSSGVGKSSLINKLLGAERIKTENIGARSGRGKHVTTTREMYFLSEGGIVIDNPGVREVGMTDTSGGIDNLFDEITALAVNCKYVDCTHTHEPGCAVLVALKAGKLDENQYTNYVNLKKEAKHYAMTKIQKKEKNRQFGKFVKTAKRGLKNFGHKYY
jgi:ribosome biogenesis GTPase